MNSKRASKVLIASGKRCNANTCPLRRCLTSWQSALSSIPKTVTMKLLSAMPSMRHSPKSINLTPQDFATGFRHQRLMDTKRSTILLCRIKVNGLKCKSVLTAWTILLKAGLPRTGSISRQRRKWKKENSTLGSIQSRKSSMIPNPTRSTSSTPSNSTSLLPNSMSSLQKATF